MLLDAFFSTSRPLHCPELAEIQSLPTPPTVPPSLGDVDMLEFCFDMPIGQSLFLLLFRCYGPLLFVHVFLFCLLRSFFALCSFSSSLLCTSDIYLRFLLCLLHTVSMIYFFFVFCSFSLKLLVGHRRTPNNSTKIGYIGERVSWIVNIQSGRRTGP